MKRISERVDKTFDRRKIFWWVLVPLLLPLFASIYATSLGLALMALLTLFGVSSPLVGFAVIIVVYAVSIACAIGTLIYIWHGFVGGSN